jgi:ATP-dependent Clp protease ATP-binding subunit ClpA
MSNLGKYVHAILDQGRAEARNDGSAMVEAQHLLLAIAAGPDATTRQILSAAGLDHDAIRAALDREFSYSLAAAGVSPASFDLPQATRGADRRPHLGASARLALERGFSSETRRNDLQPAHLLLGILRAQFGTVPRALALAGIDRIALADSAGQALAQESQSG